MKYVLIALLRAYRVVISPLYGNVCRYYPSCSAYALEAVQTHGAARGTWLSTKRLASCHPWARGGYDPVPGTDPHYEREQDEREHRTRRRPHHHHDDLPDAAHRAHKETVN